MDAFFAMIPRFFARIADKIFSPTLLLIEMVDDKILIALCRLRLQNCIRV